MKPSKAPPSNLRDILKEVEAGHMSSADAATKLESAGISDLGFARVDLDRVRRRGRPEAIFCQGKTPDQIMAIARSLLDAGQPALMTRIAAETRSRVREALRDAEILEDDLANCLLARHSPPVRRSGKVAVLSAGTSDLPVAREAAFTAEAYGSPVDLITDVGVAGLGRLLACVENLQSAHVVVVVAGMEGALPSVVAGLVKAPVVAVPTSVGYGAALDGITPLLAMLTACAPGIAVVNIDNGFGAGYYADVLNEMGDSACQTN
jgi:NCAIR mutase (PurE)-related protein